LADLEKDHVDYQEGAGFQVPPASSCSGGCGGRAFKVGRGNFNPGHVPSLRRNLGGRKRKESRLSIAKRRGGIWCQPLSRGNLEAITKDRELGEGSGHLHQAKKGGTPFRRSGGERDSLQDAAKTEVAVVPYLWGARRLSQDAPRNLHWPKGGQEERKGQIGGLGKKGPFVSRPGKKELRACGAEA